MVAGLQRAAAVARGDAEAAGLSVISAERAATLSYRHGRQSVAAPARNRASELPGADGPAKPGSASTTRPRRFPAMTGCRR